MFIQLVHNTIKLARVEEGSMKSGNKIHAGRVEESYQ